MIFDKDEHFSLALPWKTGAASACVRSKVGKSRPVTHRPERRLLCHDYHVRRQGPRARPQALARIVAAAGANAIPRSWD